MPEYYRGWQHSCNVRLAQLSLRTLDFVGFSGDLGATQRAVSRMLRFEPKHGFAPPSPKAPQQGGISQIVSSVASAHQIWNESPNPQRFEALPPRLRALISERNTGDAELFAWALREFRA